MFHQKHAYYAKCIKTITLEKESLLYIYYQSILYMKIECSIFIHDTNSINNIVLLVLMLSIV